MIESQPSQDDKTLAILTHLSGILFGFIVPLIIWLVSKDTKPWLTREAKEALNFQILVTIGYVIASVCISSVIASLIGLMLFPVIWIVNLLFCIIAAMQTSQGNTYTYPFGLRLIK